jgi:predicted O-methyltransferase YrrM
MTRAMELAKEDDFLASSSACRRFSLGKKPVIRWIKGDGLDDEVTRAAIAQATHLFGDRVDYCLCTNEISATRARSILEFSSQPVEWWPLSSFDNLVLAKYLEEAGCTPERFGYWWKWFPERVRPNAPEWILDGDMVITRIPKWFEQWVDGTDLCRVAQDDWTAPDHKHFGNYADTTDKQLLLYSGLISLPPGMRYMPLITKVLDARPLLPAHDGRTDVSEQGIIVAAFQELAPLPIPLPEFPYASLIDIYKDRGFPLPWGYHFTRAFVHKNPYFERLVHENVIHSCLDQPNIIDRFTWLGNFGQWGIPGWTISKEGASIILDKAKEFSGKRILELGTSRGRITAMLANLGCNVTTVDRHDRGASQNLIDLDVNVIVDEASRFLSTTAQKFDLIVIDFHGNSETDWKFYFHPIIRCLADKGVLVLNNAFLSEIPEWHDENGVSWFLENIPKSWNIQLHVKPIPGIAIVTSTSHDGN